jgi:hypothetical protein
MSGVVPSTDGYFKIPSWWTQPRFGISAIAEFLSGPIATIHKWLELARATGIAVGDTSLSRPLYSAREIYTLALLAKLHAVRIHVNAKIIRSAFEFVGVDGEPRPIPHDATWSVIDEAGAVLLVQAWLVFSAVLHFGLKPHYV